jgi:hypothetical protein
MIVNAIRVNTSKDDASKNKGSGDVPKPLLE